MPKNIRILYVDDNPMDRSLVRDSLEIEHGGFILTEASSKAEFEKIIDEKEFDVVLTDFNILGYEGLQVLDTVKIKQPGVPVIVVTGTGSEAVAVEAMKRGAADYVIKSAQHIQRLPQTISTALKMEEAITERALTEDKLLVNQYYLSKAQEMGKIGTWELDIQNDNLVWTEENYKIFGVPVGTKMNYRKFLKCIHPDDKDLINKKWAEALKTKQYDVEHRILVKNKIKWVREKADFELDPDGNPIVAIGFAQDITERKEFEESLKESEERYRQLIDSSPEAIVIHQHGKVVFANNKAFEMIKDPNAEKLIGTEFRKLLHPDQLKIALERTAKLLKGESVTNPVQYRLKDFEGSYFDVEMSSAAVKHKGENAIQLVVRDITERKKTENEIVENQKAAVNLLEDLTVEIEERKKAETQLKESEEKFRAIFENTLTAIVVADDNKNLTAVNKAAEQLFGYSKAELQELDADDIKTIFPREDDERGKRFIEQGQESGEIEFVTKDGFERISHYQSVRIKPGFNLSMVNDITEQKRALLSLSESEDRFRNLVNTISSGVTIYEVINDGINASDYILKEINNSALKMENLEKSEVVGKSLKEFRPEIEDYGLIPIFTKVWESGIPEFYPLHINVDEKTSKYFEFRVFKLPNGELVAVYDDVTEKTIALQNLKESEERFEAFMNYFPGAAFIKDEEHNLVYCNTQYAKSINSTPDQLKGSNQFHLLPSELAEQYKKENEIVLSHGEMIRAESSLIEDGVETHWLSVKFPLSTESSGKMMGTISLDITERKRVEIALKESEKKYRSLFENQIESYAYHEIILDKKGKPVDYKFIDVNEKFLSQTGLNSKDEIIGKTLLEKWPASEKKWIEIYGKIAKGGEPKSFEDYSLAMDRYYRINAYSPKKGFFATSFVDITNEVKAEQAQREADLKLRNVMLNSTNMFYQHDTKHKLTFISPQVKDLVGFTPEEAMVKWTELLSDNPINEEGYKKTVKAIKTGIPQPPYQLELLHKKGKKVWVEVREVPEIDNGKVVSIIGTLVDITERKKYEEEILELNRNLTISQKIAKLGYWNFDIKTQKPKWSDELFNMYGIPKEEGEPIYEDHKKYIHPEDWEHFDKSVMNLIENEVPYDIQLRLIHRDGSIVWVRSIGLSRKDKKGKVVELYGTTLDITEMKKAEEERRASDERFRIAQDMSPEGFTILQPVRDAKGRVIDFTWIYENEAIAKLNGTDPQQVVGKRLLELFPGHQNTNFLKAYQKVAESGEPLTLEESYVGESISKETWFRLVVVPMAENIAILTQDITERKKYEEEILELNRTLTLAQKIAKLGYWSFDVKTQKPKWSDEIFKMYGISKEQDEPSYIEQKNYIHPEDWESFDTSVKNLIENEVPYDIQYRVVHKNGNTLWLRSTGLSKKDENDKVIELYGTVLDITFIKKQEKEIEINLTKYKTLFANMPAGITVSDSSGKIIESNIIAEKLLGINEEEQKNRNVNGTEWSIIRPDGSQMPPKEFASVRALAEKKTVDNVEMGIDKGNNNVTWISVTATPIPLENYGVLINYFDISDRKNAEVALKESEEKFRSIVNNAQVGIFRTNAEDGALLMANQKTAEIFGYKTIDAACRYYKLSEHYVDPDQREKLVEQVKKNGRIDNFEAVLTNRFNEPRWVKYSVHYNKEGDYFEGVVEDITESKVLQNKYETIVHNFPNGAIFLFDKEMKYSFVGGSALEKEGIKGKNLVGHKPNEVWPKDLVKTVISNNRKILKGNLVNYETKFNNKIFANWGVPIYEGDNLVNGLVYSVDITELKERNEFIQTVMDNLPIGIALNNIDEGNAFYTNRKFEQIYGWPADELIDISDFFKKVYPDKNYREKLIAQIMSDIKSGDSSKMHWEDCIITHKDGSKHIINAQNIPLYDQNTMVSTVVDVTAQKEAERLLKESEAFLKAALDNSQAGIAIADVPDGKLRYVNKAGLMIRGKNEEEIVKNIDINKYVSSWRILHFDGTEYKPEDVPLARAVLYGDNVREEFIVRRDDEEDRYVLAHAAPINNEDGERIAAIVAFLDITEIKEAEQKIAESEERYKTLVESAPDAIAIHQNKKLAFVNPASVKLLEAKNREELIGLNVKQIIHPLYLKEVEARIEGLLSGAEKYYTIEEKYVTLKGNEIDVEVTAVPILFENKEALQVIVRDVTERKRAAQQILKERNRAEQYLESAEVMMLFINEKGIVKMINRKGSEILGYSKQYIIGENWFEKFIPKEDTAKMKEIFASAIKGEIDFVQYYENPVLCRYNKVRIIGWHNNVVKDSSGEIYGVLSSGEDITESIRLKNELQKSNEELTRLSIHMRDIREKERLSLARELHDDLGQALTAIKMDLMFSMSSLREEDELLKKKLNSAIDLTAHSIKTTQQITSELRPSMIDDLGLIPAVEWYTSQFMERSSIKINLDIDVEESDFKNDFKINIYRILQECLTNAARHSKASRVSIKFKKQNNNVILTINDNGIGLESSKLTDPNSFGLIGLKERAYSLNGKISFKGKKNKGTLVEVVFPLNK